MYLLPLCLSPTPEMRLRLQVLKVVSFLVTLGKENATLRAGVQ